MNVSYSVPGRIILSGKYTAIFGNPVLASAIDKRITFNLFESDEKKKDTIVSIVEQTVKDILIKKGIRISDVNYGFDIVSEIPKDQDLGYKSAVYVVATAAFLTFYSGKEFPIEEVNQIAFQIAKKFDKLSSGLDTTVSSLGGLIFYRKEFEFLKGIYQLQFRIPKKIEEHLYIVPEKKGNSEIEANIGRLLNNNSKKGDLFLKQIEKLTKRIIVSIVKEDEVFFANNLNEENIYINKTLYGELTFPPSLIFSRKKVSDKRASFFRQSYLGLNRLK